MSYSRWGGRGSGHWYTYWCVSLPETVETKDNAVFEICSVCSFTAKQLRTDMNKCIKHVEGFYNSTYTSKTEKKELLNELSVYMKEFLVDVEEEYN